MEELIIQVDEDNSVIGKKPKKDFLKSDLIHRSSHLIVLNSRGEILIQKRSNNVELYPGTYDFAVGGTLAVGETHDTNLRKEMEEELGVTLPFKEIFRYYCFDDADKAFKVVYSATYDGPFNLQKEEVEDVKWVNPEYLMKNMEEDPESYNPPFIKGMTLFLNNHLPKKVPPINLSSKESSLI